VRTARLSCRNAGSAGNAPAAVGDRSCAFFRFWPSCPLSGGFIINHLSDTAHSRADSQPPVAECPLRVMSESRGKSTTYLLFPQKRAFVSAIGMALRANCRHAPSLMVPRANLIKIGAKAVGHGRCVACQMARLQSHDKWFRRHYGRTLSLSFRAIRKIATGPYKFEVRPGNLGLELRKTSSE